MAKKPTNRVLKPSKKTAKKRTKFCCKMMTHHATYRCDMHPDPFDCPDNLIAFYKPNKYGLIIHDGGSSFIRMRFCPWCGRRLSQILID